MIGFTGKSWHGAKIRKETVDVTDLMRRKKMRRINYVRFRPYQTEKALERAEAMVGDDCVYHDGYDFWECNCEHVRTGMVFNHQAHHAHTP